MEKYDKLYSICLNDKHVNALIDIICEYIKLSERSIPKCAAMITTCMKQNIGQLSKYPKNNEQLKEFVKILDRACVNTIIEVIAKKHPELHINKKKQVSKEQMRRDLDVWPDRDNHVQNRPHMRTRKEYDDDETFYNMKPNDTGFPGCENTGGYASAFGNHLITNIPIGSKQPPYNNPHSQKNTTRFQQQYELMMAERNNDMRGNQRPPEPDFTLDGSGDRVKNEKLRRQMESTQMIGNGMDNMVGINTSFSGMPTDDPYASLLGAGAPGMYGPGMPGQGMGQGMPGQGMPGQGMPGQGIGQGMANPFMGMGNPLMPMSSSYLMSDQTNKFDGGSSVKSAQLQNDYEKKMAERRQIDVETNQPQQSATYSNQMGMMGNMGNMGMPMNNMSMGMPMNNMPMNNMAMSNMPMNGMPMNGMPMNGMPMNGMPMSNMPMSNIPMNGIPMNGMPMNNMNIPMISAVM